MARKKNRTARESAPKALIRAFGTVLLAVLLFAVYFKMADANPLPQPYSQADASEAQASATKLYFIDVGQGDAMLICQNGRYALIDAGTKSSEANIIKTLDALNVQTLDYLIMTHPHADHIGGMRAVVENYAVQKMILPDFEKFEYPTTSTFLKLMQAVQQKQIPTETALTGTEYPLGEGKITIVGDGIISPDYNNISITTRFTGGGLTYLSTGDAELEAEEALLASGQPLQADLFKAGHHGSSTSNSRAFLNKVRPKAVFIGCGKDNEYGHPHKEVESAFRQMGAVVYRTDHNGTIFAYVAADGSVKLQAEKI